MIALLTRQLFSFVCKTYIVSLTIALICNRLSCEPSPFIYQSSQKTFINIVALLPFLSSANHLLIALDNGFSSPLPLLLSSWKRLQSANRHCRRSWTAITQLRMQVSPTNPLPLSSPCCPLWMLLFFSSASSCTLHLCESVTWS